EIRGQVDALGAADLAGLGDDAVEQLSGGRRRTDLTDRQADRGGRSGERTDERELRPQCSLDGRALIGAEAGGPACLDQAADALAGAAGPFADGDGRRPAGVADDAGLGDGGEDRSEEHTSELQSRENLVCR